MFAFNGPRRLAVRTPKGRTSSERGVTLIELVVTLAIIGILVIAALWSAQSGLSARAQDGAVRTVMGDIARCESLAIKQNRVFRIAFTPGTNTTYQLQRENAPLSMVFENYMAPVSIIPETTSASVNITLATNYVAPAANVMEFNPRGTLFSQGTVTLSMPNRTRRIATSVIGRSCIVETDTGCTAL